MLEWLPAAVLDPHPRSFPWQETTSPKGCLHTTEGSGWPGYDGWTIMPHATVLPAPGKGVTVRQHLPFSQASFALQHTRSQPTNGDYVFQFELIGTSEKGGPGLYWPDADDTVLLDLYRKVIKPLDDAMVIPFRAPTFLPYPASYGNTSVRMTDGQFDTYSGWLGHEHVPQNDHGDPGAFPWKRLVSLAGDRPKPPAPKPAPLVVDGDLGPATIRRLQAFINTHGANPKVAVDGDLGTKTWLGVQQWIGHAPANGVADRDTVRDLQTKVGATRDGVLGVDTIEALQRYLNAHA